MRIRLPTITVVTPSYNQADFLQRTIESVLDQHYPGLEYFVLDGGSTDGSLDVIRRYSKHLDYWVSQPDGGQASAINAGWRRADGEVLAWLNSDDFYLPGALRAVGEGFVQHPQASIIYGRTRRVGPDGSTLGIVGSPFRWSTLLYSHQLIPQPSAFFRRAALEAVGPLDESLNYSMDYDLILRLASLGPPVMLQEVLAAATIHPDAKTTRDREKAAAETHAIRLRYARGLSAMLVRLQPAMSWGFRRMPGPVRACLGGLRPRRVYDDAAPRA